MRRNGRGPDDGAVAVEFALIGGFILIPLLFAVLQYGFFFFESTGAEHATREGARYVSVRGTAGPPTLNAVVDAAAPNFPTPPTAVACWSDEDGSGDYTRGDTLEVTMTWTPSLPNFGVVPFLDGPFTETAVTRVERSDGITPPGAC